MKRICIYVIFDKQNTINAYIEAVLRELKKFVDDIIVVCNFESIKSGEHYLHPYAEKVYCRKNIGFDSGAYKDALEKYVGWTKIEEYDELLLTNDTYFAPIYPFDDLFETMSKCECDYWGITKHPSGCFNDGYAYNEHIQSYFLCFKKEVLVSRKLKEFWEEYTYVDNRDLAIREFELKINDYLRANHFKGRSYMEERNLNVVPYNSNPYNVIAYELIKDYEIPILKKTNFYGKNWFLVNALKALSFIDEECDYDATLIKSYIKEYQRKGLIGTYYDFEQMDRFIKEHKRIYIYGAGRWGTITKDYFDYRGYKYENVLVTKADAEDEVEFDSVQFDSNDGIVIAQEWKNVCDEIKTHIKERVSEEHIFTPCYPHNQYKKPKYLE